MSTFSSKLFPSSMLLSVFFPLPSSSLSLWSILFFSSILSASLPISLLKSSFLTVFGKLFISSSKKIGKISFFKNICLSLFSKFFPLLFCSMINNKFSASILTSKIEILKTYKIISNNSSCLS